MTLFPRLILLNLIFLCAVIKSSDQPGRTGRLKELIGLYEAPSSEDPRKDFETALLQCAEKIELYTKEERKKASSLIYDINRECDVSLIEAIIAIKNPDETLAATLNSKRPFGQTPLELACMRHHLKIVKLILSAKNPDETPAVDINAKNEFGSTFLSRTVRCINSALTKTFIEESLKLVKLLLEEGAIFDRESIQELLYVANSLLNFDQQKKAKVKQILKIFEAEQSRIYIQERGLNVLQERDLLLTADLKDLSADQRDIRSLLTAYKLFVYGPDEGQKDAYLLHRKKKNKPLIYLLLREPGTVHAITGRKFCYQAMGNALFAVFKPDSIRSLLRFLVESKYDEQAMKGLLEYINLTAETTEEEEAENKEYILKTQLKQHRASFDYEPKIQAVLDGLKIVPNRSKN